MTNSGARILIPQHDQGPGVQESAQVSKVVRVVSTVEHYLEQ